MAKGWGEVGVRNFDAEVERLLKNCCFFFSSLYIVWGGLQRAGPGQCFGLEHIVPRWGVHLWWLHRATLGLSHHRTAPGEEVSFSLLLSTEWLQLSSLMTSCLRAPPSVLQSICKNHRENFSTFSILQQGWYSRWESQCHSQSPGHVSTVQFCHPPHLYGGHQARDWGWDRGPSDCW